MMTGSDRPASAANGRATALPVHKSTILDYDYVYAVVSRRAGGVSLGINLNPDKVCNFDCPYCQVDRSEPGRRKDVDPAQVLREVADLAGRVASRELFTHTPDARFANVPEHLQRMRDVAFAGDGEPTTCRHFEDIVRGVAEMRGTLLPHDSFITLITNASMLHRTSVERALDVMDRNNGRIWAKLDAGTEGFYRLVDKTNVPFSRILENLLLTGRRRPITIQSLFHAIEGAPPPQREIDEYLRRLCELRDGGAQIEMVQVYTIARRPASESVSPLDRNALEEIAARVRAQGLRAEVYV